MGVDAVETRGDGSAAAGEDTLKLVAVTRYNLDKALDLNVAPEQEKFVGTVAEALVRVKYYPERELHPMLLEVDGRAVGFCMWRWYEERRDGAPGVELNRLLIHSGYQREGYGRRFLGLLRDYWQEEGGTKQRHVSITVTLENLGAMAFYRKVLGAEEVEEDRTVTHARFVAKLWPDEGECKRKREEAE